MTLLILAAGMGSRYGGLKQLDPMTDAGEFIIDFSIFDAIRAGFDRVVFVIKEENYDLFRSTVGARIERRIRTEYVFQKSDDLPAGFVCPGDRVKPWGTAQAVLCAESVMAGDSFAVINADDFYGRDAFERLAVHLGSCGKNEYCMVGYILKNTLTENGTVSRGECRTSEAGELISVCERTGIARKGNVAVYAGENGEPAQMPLDTVVSMNCWGFTSTIFDGLRKSFTVFLGGLKTLPHEKAIKAECYLPNSVQEMMNAGGCRVAVYPTSAVWHGVTYHEDKEEVKSAIASLIAAGEYPNGLWK